jgi:REP element-mobilizing transposase RayT
VNQARRTPGAPLWQRNYYERIIRDEQALQSVRRYIEANPVRWAAGAR